MATLDNDAKRKLWWHAVILAIAVALLLEIWINIFGRRTIWHRIDALEHQVQQMSQQLEEIRTEQPKKHK